jgi:hypothetical protein
MEVNGQPNTAWGPLFMLSPLGEQQAVPLARKAGKTFFSVKLSYFEDRELFRRRCPENGECECAGRSLIAWRFADGRQFVRSD